MFGHELTWLPETHELDTTTGISVLLLGRPFFSLGLRICQIYLVKIICLHFTIFTLTWYCVYAVTHFVLIQFKMKRNLEW